MAKPPWSNRQLRVLGTKVREGSSGYASDPSYDAVLSYFNGLAISAQTRLDNLDWEPLLGTRIPEVTSRPKTIDALRQKLQRNPATPLQSVQDSVANAVAGMFEQSREVAVRGIRYGGLPKDGASRQMVSALHKLSTEIAGIENQRNLLDRRERELAEASGVAANAPRSPHAEDRRGTSASHTTGTICLWRPRNASYSLRINAASRREQPLSGFLIEYNRSTSERRVTAFEGQDGPQRALAERLRRERDRTDGNWEIVSPNSKSVATIKTTHSRYLTGQRLSASVAWKNLHERGRPSHVATDMPPHHGRR